MIRQADGSWYYPPLETEMVDSVLKGVSELIVTTPIMDMCMEVERHPGARVYQRCWGQVILELEGMREVSRAAEMEEMERDEDGDNQDA